MKTKTREPDCRNHTKFDGSYWVYDANSVQLCRVCPKCRKEKLRKYRPEVLKRYDRANIYEGKPMDFNEYQHAAARTATYPTIRITKMTVDRSDAGCLVYPVLGLTSEAGELSGKLKKIIRDKGAVIDEKDAEELTKELGDVLWYCAAIAGELGVSLDDVAQANIKKLGDRAKRGVIGGSGDNR